MHRFKSHILCQMLVLFVLLALPLSARAQNGIVAVLSSDLGPYGEAYAGFVEAYGQPVALINLKNDRFQLPSDTRVVVAFGGKAALLDYPDNVALIYCLAPGVCLSSEYRRGRSAKVAMVPTALSLLTHLRQVQPALHRLSVFWASEAQEAYLQELGVVAEGLGIHVRSIRVSGADDLPDGLRAVLRQGVEGIWLPPDPVLINARSFSLFREFSRSNDVPLYVPTSSLLNRGAVASVACSFDEIGRTAGRLALTALSGGVSSGVVHPERVAFRVNEKAAQDAGLEISRDSTKVNGRQAP